MPEQTTSLDSFGTRATLNAGGTTYNIFRLDKAAQELGINLNRLPFTLRVLFENLLRGEDGANVTADHIRACPSVLYGKGGKLRSSLSKTTKLELVTGLSQSSSSSGSLYSSRTIHMGFSMASSS